MRSEPGVDARHVEGVAALRKHPYGISVAKFAEADGTVRSVDQALAPPVLRDGDGVYDQLRKPSGGDHLDWVDVLVLRHRHTVLFGGDFVGSLMISSEIGQRKNRKKMEAV